MSPTLRLRHARQEDLPSMARVAVDAYKDDEVSARFFPEHLRANPGDKDELDFRLERMQASFEAQGNNFLVVVEDKGDTRGSDGVGAQAAVLGFAQWVSPDRPGPEKTAEEIAKQKTDAVASYPPSYDVEFRAEFDAAGVKLIEAINTTLGEEAAKNAWCKSDGIDWISSVSVS